MERRTSDGLLILDVPDQLLDFTISGPHRVLVMSEQCVHHSSVSLLSPQHFSRIPLFLIFEGIHGHDCDKRKHRKS